MIKAVEFDFCNARQHRKEEVEAGSFYLLRFKTDANFPSDRNRITFKSAPFPNRLT